MMCCSYQVFPFSNSSLKYGLIALEWLCCFYQFPHSCITWLSYFDLCLHEGCILVASCWADFVMLLIALSLRCKRYFRKWLLMKWLLSSFHMVLHQTHYVQAWSWCCKIGVIRVFLSLISISLVDCLLAFAFALPPLCQKVLYIKQSSFSIGSQVSKWFTPYYLCRKWRERSSILSYEKRMKMPVNMDDASHLS